MQMFSTFLKPFQEPRERSIMITTGPCTAPLCAGFCTAGKFNVSEGQFVPSSLLYVQCLHNFDTHDPIPAPASASRRIVSRSDVLNRIHSGIPTHYFRPSTRTLTSTPDRR